jgi:YXWGXW repeat-containing protein
MRRLGVLISVLFSMAMLAMPAVSTAQVICISNVSPPPELPVYEQPPIPAPGYLWSPGYWGSGPNGYFWVPGTWVQPPTVGLLWTPGYWGWRDGIYIWNAGYWGPHVGFYGGVNYGFGYGGAGYEGGRWENGVFAYNRTVNNFGSVRITNVYEKTVIVEAGASRVSFNGGSGGMTTRPTPEEEAAAHEQHVAAIPAQLQHERTASADKALLASENHGKPAIAATARPSEFTGKGVMAAREEKPVMTPAAKPNSVSPVERSADTPKDLEKKQPEGKNEATLNHEAPAKPAHVEGKPANVEGANADHKSTTGMRRDIEAKPENEAKHSIEAKPDSEAKRDIEAKPNGEVKPNNETRPNTAAKPAIAEKTPTGSIAKPAPHVVPGKPAPKDKKPE